MNLSEIFAVASAIGGVYLLLHEGRSLRNERPTNQDAPNADPQPSVRRFRVLGFKLSVLQVVGFVLSTAGFLLLIGLKSGTPAWWSIVKEKRSQELASWITEPGKLAIFWFLAVVSIGSAILVATAKSHRGWLDSCLIFSISVAVLFVFLGNLWALCFSLPVIAGIAWTRKASSPSESNDSNENSVHEPMLVSCASVLFGWLLAVSLHWTIEQEAAPERLKETRRAIPRVAISSDDGSRVDANAEPQAVVESNETWLIALSVMIMGLSGLSSLTPTKKAGEVV
jgi:hypothetical protein